MADAEPASSAPPATIAFTCSCGAHAELRASMRGIEQACSECGRIYRIPAVGDKLDLRAHQGAQNKRDLADLQSLLRATAPARRKALRIGIGLWLMGALALAAMVWLALSLLAWL